MIDPGLHLNGGDHVSTNTLMNKVAIVTGAAGGIGREVSYSLAKEGIHVVMTDHSPSVFGEFESILADFPLNQGFPVQMDITDESEVSQLMANVVETLGSIDIMVNNAAIVQDMLPVVDTPLYVLQRIMEVNVNGVFLGSKYAAKQMIKQRSGSIINISSYFGKTGHKYFASYSASKAAIIAFSQSLAYELADFGITVNSICPGDVATEMHWKTLRDEAEMRGISFDEVKESVVSRIPLRRHGTGQDIAGAILYLASEYGSYVTGQAINVNGGIEVH